jgi:4-hydroxy-3-methylbut-2-enyl diphosphate reductase
MKQFEIPSFYKSPIIGRIKEARKLSDPRKKDFTPTVLDFGPVQFLIPRHFGFCYGVENAIEISYKALDENPDRRIFLLSQMIHNPEVNADLVSHGIQFIMDTEGNQFIPWDNLTANDVVIIPAFGTTVEVEALLTAKGIEIQKYNTTCPFVEKVWNRSEKLGAEKFTVIIHGKYKHEETRATFSRSYQNAPSLVIKNMAEAELVADFIRGSRAPETFYSLFEGKYSTGFDVEKDLQKVGVINQTTMLATETQAIADFFKRVMNDKYGTQSGITRFADTRDTLCYATNDNQQATYGVLEHAADIAIVVGGYNSSNTSHIVELCEENMPTYFIMNETEIESHLTINHFNYSSKVMLRSEGWLPTHKPVRVVLTSGASCPDATVDRVMQRILGFFDDVLPIEEALGRVLTMPQ